MGIHSPSQMKDMTGPRQACHVKPCVLSRQGQQRAGGQDVRVDCRLHGFVLSLVQQTDFRKSLGQSSAMAGIEWA